MDDDTPPRRSRLGASTLGAAALLVLSFGPAALALSPSTAQPSSAAPARVVVSAPAAAAAAHGAARAQDEQDGADGASDSGADADEA